MHVWYKCISVYIPRYVQFTGLLSKVEPMLDLRLNPILALLLSLLKSWSSVIISGVVAWPHEILIVHAAANWLIEMSSGHDHYHNYIGVTDEINKAIKATARTITKSSLSDKICLEVLLQKAGLKCLDEAVASITAVTVWKTKTFIDPLSQHIFWEKSS